MRSVRASRSVRPQRGSRRGGSRRGRDNAWWGRASLNPSTMTCPWVATSTRVQRRRPSTATRSAAKARAADPAADACRSKSRHARRAITGRRCPLSARDAACVGHPICGRAAARPMVARRVPARTVTGARDAVRLPADHRPREQARTRPTVKRIERCAVVGRNRRWVLHSRRRMTGGPVPRTCAARPVHRIHFRQKRPFHVQRNWTMADSADCAPTRDSVAPTSAVPAWRERTDHVGSARSGSVRGGSSDLGRPVDRLGPPPHAGIVSPDRAIARAPGPAGYLDDVARAGQPRRRSPRALRSAVVTRRSRDAMGAAVRCEPCARPGIGPDDRRRATPRCLRRLAPGWAAYTPLNGVNGPSIASHCDRRRTNAASRTRMPAVGCWGPHLAQPGLAPC